MSPFVALDIAESSYVVEAVLAIFIGSQGVVLSMGFNGYELMIICLITLDAKEPGSKMKTR